MTSVCLDPWTILSETLEPPDCASVSPLYWETIHQQLFLLIVGKLLLLFWKKLKKCRKKEDF